ncbi:MAG TPA: PLP-dependent transferase, partial [Bryobacterales bacterium]|nr:PLP-dependent transferase [Bryobacterales bacterium]
MVSKCREGAFSTGAAALISPRDGLAHARDTMMPAGKSDMSERSPADGRRAPARITTMLHAGRGRHTPGLVAPPLERASTILAPDVATYETEHPYGTQGTAAAHALAEALLSIEGGDACLLYPSGLAAIAGTLMALTRSGDHVLITDAVYYPTRRLLNELLAGYGVRVTWFDPRAPVEEVTGLFTPATTVLFLESPGSDSMEVLDVPALAAAARERGVVTVIDNTWSAGWLFDPFAAGVDVSIQALTKYQNGHSDVLAGAVLCTAALAPRLRAVHRMLGQLSPPDDAWLVLRGLRS